MTLRFIAGAACPHCHATDTIRARMEDGSILSAECVVCDWKADKPPPAEMPTGETGEIAKVRILDPNED